jgi:hypothetical protein
MEEGRADARVGPEGCRLGSGPGRHRLETAIAQGHPDINFISNLTHQAAVN